MKRSVSLSFAIGVSLLMCVTAPGAALAQGTCALGLAGTWSAEDPAGLPVRYRFDPDGTLSILSRTGPERSSDWREIARGTYVLDDPRTPAMIRVRVSAPGGSFPRGTTTLAITGHDETSFTAVMDGSRPTRWTRVETDRYFMVLAGRSGTFYDNSGPAFAMLIRRSGPRVQVDAVGIHSTGSTPVFGAIPAKLYGEFMNEPRNASDVMLRLEIAGGQYERSLGILRTWERRAREGALLYPDVFMDNILLVKQVTEELNRCGETIKLYKLDWGLEDDISENNRPPSIPFQYFKELRRLNQSRHVRDGEMPKARSGEAAGR